MIQFNNGFIIIDRDWVDFKKILNGTEKTLRAQYELDIEAYRLYAVDDKIIYRHDILLEGKELDTWSEEQVNNNIAARNEFEMYWKSTFNKQLLLHDLDGSIKMAAEIPYGSKTQLISVNWCDKCSWYPGSVKVEDEILISDDNIRFHSKNKFWIDMAHGRMSYEDAIVKGAGGAYIPIITADDVTVGPSTDSDEEYYSIDYENGDVIFSSSQTGKTIKATYWYATNGSYIIKPDPGKKLKIFLVEVQFSRNVVLNDIMYYQAFGYAGAFAPQLVPPLQATDLIPLIEPTVYKRMTDYINEANGAFPLIPACGGPKYGTKDDTIVFQWHYLTRTDLSSSAGMEIRIGLLNSTPHDGELATATFYAVSEDE